MFNEVSKNGNSEWPKCIIQSSLCVCLSVCMCICMYDDGCSVGITREEKPADVYTINNNQSGSSDI